MKALKLATTTEPTGAVATAQRSVTEMSIEVKSAVYGLTASQRLILRLMLHRAEPLSTSAIRFGLATYFYNKYRDDMDEKEGLIIRTGIKAGKSSEKNRQEYLDSLWQPVSTKEVIEQLKRLKKHGLRQEIPSYKGIETQLENLKKIGFVFDTNEPQKGANGFTIWQLNPLFVTRYFEEAEQVKEGVHPKPVLAFFEKTWD